MHRGKTKRQKPKVDIEFDIRNFQRYLPMIIVLPLLHQQELELRIDTQKQTLQQRDESIKKLLEMLQSKGEGESDRRLHFFLSRNKVNRIRKLQLSAVNTVMDLMTTNAQRIDMALKMRSCASSAPCTAWQARELRQSCDVIKAHSGKPVFVYFFSGVPNLILLTLFDNNFLI